MVYILFNTKRKCWVAKDGRRAKDINNAKAWNYLKELRAFLKEVRSRGAHGTATYKNMQINKLSLDGTDWTLIRRKRS